MVMALETYPDSLFGLILLKRPVIQANAGEILYVAKGKEKKRKEKRKQQRRYSIAYVDEKAVT